MKTKISKILGVVLSLALLTSMAVIAVPVSAAGNPAVVDSWENLNLPITDPNTDVKLIEQAEDGTIFISVARYYPGTFTQTDNVDDEWEIDANTTGDEASASMVMHGTWSSSMGVGNGVYPINMAGVDNDFQFNLEGTLTVSGSSAIIELSGTIYDVSDPALDRLADGESTGTDSFDNGGGFTLGSYGAGGGYIDVVNLLMLPDSGAGAIIDGYFDLSSEYMYKSADGYIWEETCLQGVNPITAIEPSDHYSADETVYVAIDTQPLGYTTIYRCTEAADDGVNPSPLGQISAGESGVKPATYVYDLDSYYDGDDVWLLAATDIDVFAIPDDLSLTTIWTDMELSETLGGSYADDYAGPETGGVAVFWAEFAPDFGSSGVIWGLYWDSNDTSGYGLIARSSGSTEWGTVITPVIIDDGGSDAKVECDVEFAADYTSDATPDLFAALSFWGSSAGDDIYSIECNFFGDPGDVTPFDVDPTNSVDFCSLEVSGNKLVAGSFDYGGWGDNCEVWVSLNDGITWNMATKNPTGEIQFTCNLLWSNGEGDSPDDAILAATGGDQSAISISEDDGDTWNQIAFIDDYIDYLKDMAFDSTSTSALLITVNSTIYPTWPTDSLWKTDDVTARFPQWQRVLCEEYSTTIDNFDLVEYSMDGAVAMLYDEEQDKIYRSSNEAQTFHSFKSTLSWDDINDWVVYDSSSVYAACDNGFWSTAVVGSDLTGVELVSITLQPGFDPDDADDSVLIVGGTDGSAYVSYDAGDNLEPGTTIAITPGGYVADGDVYSAFDAEYQDNGLVYFAADDGGTNFVAYGTLDVNGTFYHMAGPTKVAGCTPLASAIATNGHHTVVSGYFIDIIVSEDNTLYVLSEYNHMMRYLLHDEDAAGNQSDWDLADNSIPNIVDEMWVTTGSNTVWTMGENMSDSTYHVWLLDDVLTGTDGMVTGITVSNIGPFSATVSWNAVPGATDYEVIFYTLVGTTWYADYHQFTNATTITAPTYSLYDHTAYIVNIRVNNDEVMGGSIDYYSDPEDYIHEEVELGRWNDGSFTTLYYVSMPVPTNPSQGADEVSLTPSFGWSAATNAVTYNFELSADPGFNTLIDSVSVDVTAYTYTGDGLDWDTDYYWRVQAVAPDGTESEWSTYTETFFYIDIPAWLPTYDPLVKWVSGAISNFHTEEEEFPPVTVEPAPTPTLTVDVNIPEIVLPDITVNPPAITVPLPEQTVTSVTNVIQMPEDETPIYIWLIVAIGAVLTIAVIVLIIRTRRVV